MFKTTQNTVNIIIHILQIITPVFIDTLTRVRINRAIVSISIIGNC